MNIAWVNHLLYDLVVLTTGSYGAFVLFNEFVEIEKIHSLNTILTALQKRWYALLALFTAIILFMYHLITGLKS